VSRDVDLFVHDADDRRALVRQLQEVATSCGADVRVQRDAGGHVRAELSVGSEHLEPLPEMLEPLDADQLRAYRDELAARLRAMSTPPGR
jgi:hypothetical protein